MKHLLVNAVVTPDGTRLQSMHRHDYQEHVDANGETYVTDGGMSYLRRSVNKVPAKDASVYSDDPHETIREAFRWGTRGRGGLNPIEWKILSTLEDDHIEAILETQRQLAAHIIKVFKDEQQFRKNELTKTL
jgi:hypothetical protein